MHRDSVTSITYLSHCARTGSRGQAGIGEPEAFGERVARAFRQSDRARDPISPGSCLQLETPDTGIDAHAPSAAVMMG